MGARDLLLSDLVDFNIGRCAETTPAIGIAEPHLALTGRFDAVQQV